MITIIVDKFEHKYLNSLMFIILLFIEGTFSLTYYPSMNFSILNDHYNTFFFISNTRNKLLPIHLNGLAKYIANAGSWKSWLIYFNHFWFIININKIWRILSVSGKVWVEGAQSSYPICQLLKIYLCFTVHFELI